MARFRYKHIQSTVEDKRPSDLLDGELAVNRFKGKERIFLKNANNEIISFSSDSLINKELENKANVSDFSAHTANTEIHVTSVDKTTWNAKVDTSAIADFFDDAKYEDSGTTKVINFYHGNTIKATIDASDFIVDGMVDDVRIENGNLVIDFNTDSGKQDISIPLTDIFDPSNYYNKTEIDDLVGSGFTSSSITNVIIENEEIVSAALTDLDERKLDASAYTPTDLSNYYTKSETSGATEISNALGGKVNSATFTAHTANTTAHITAAERTSWNNAASGVTDLSGQSETIAAALNDLNTRVSENSTNKADISDVEELEETLVAAITDVNSRAADKEELKALVNDYQDFKLTYENRRERKRFTNRDDFFANLKRAAADQNLERYGLKVGDYLNYNGHDYVIAGLNTMRGPYSPYRLTTDHVGLIVIPHTTQAWNVSGNTYQSTYTYATSGGTWTAGAGAGYANSDLHHYMTETLLPIVKADLDSYASGILKHHKLYSNAVNTSGYNRFGSAGGCSSSWAWYENQEICALSEVQVYGSIVWSSSGYDTGEACRQLDVFRVYNMNEIFGNEYPWLRDVSSASYACIVDYYGVANVNTASYAHSVAALILFA